MDTEDGGNVDGFIFSDIANLTGGSDEDIFDIQTLGDITGTASGGEGDDSFVLADTVVVAGLLAGGDGLDTVDWTDYSTAIVVTLSNVGGDDPNGFDGGDGKGNEVEISVRTTRVVAGPSMPEELTGVTRMV